MICGKPHIFTREPPGTLRVFAIYFWDSSYLSEKEIMTVHPNSLSRWISAFRLMRIPFSVYLMPVFWMALSLTDGAVPLHAVVVFAIIHLLVYPASNGYNSWHDRDEGSIGGLKTPPRVTKELFWLVLLFDGLGLILSWLISPLFFAGILVYTLVSKAYSQPTIRLKKYPILSAGVVSVFQGFWMFLTIQVGLGYSTDQLSAPVNVGFALISTLFLLGSYPLTQVYQHAEDSRRGDKTLSLLLGINGTFFFARLVLGLAGLALTVMLILFTGPWNAMVFIIGMIPVLAYFELWFYRVRKDPAEADFENTMWMNRWSSVSLSLVFIIHLIIRSGWLF